jgi:tetratricopeptide (TPR) repeat protein
LTQSDTKLEDLIRRQLEEEGYPGEEKPREEEQLFRFEEAEATADAGPGPEQACLVLTHPWPAGFGEALVTEFWLPPAPAEEEDEPREEPPRWERREEKTERPHDSQRAWEERQELRELGLLRERAFLTYDARYETYWGQVAEAQEKASEAIICPYTPLVAQFADAHTDRMADHRTAAREYGRAGEELLELGRAYVAIWRHKGARAALEAAAKAEPQDPRVWYNLGVLCLFTRANARAREALAKAVDETPGDFRAELALGCACYHLRDYAAAEQHFRRLAGGQGLRATARSLLACAHRMQGNWEDARVELSFLRDARPGDWEAMARQCLDCVARGEGKHAGVLRLRRRGSRMWKALAAAGAGGLWAAYAAARDLFEKETQWAVIPLFVLALLVARMLRGISGRELPGEFGNAEQGLPCWQATTWMKPKRSEF